ncbi:hypothetical protein [Streptomyces sp. SID14515]|uniref:hypothetical protein n=1 Tax=Streptomyces sp. SID14515 TaxID=2706074 RepID=UPI0013CBAF24|nr:hypothetical protein [Streptomyces sp. SID14515]NEB40923.1 hypothetical protein [Streptomyces sp. SID14515]NEB42095.1 hypothetical protein [Streptomyces sp. SID14515]
MKIIRILSISSIALLSASLVGCGQQGAQELSAAPSTVGAAGSPSSPGPLVQRQGWPAEVPTSGLVKGKQLPLEKFMISYADEMLIQEARDTVELSCMQRLGFPGWKTETIGSNPPLSSNSSNMQRRYGLSDASQAAQNGYQLPARSQRNGAQDIAGQETPEAVVALTGKSNTGERAKELKGRSLPENGCIGEVQRTVGNSNMDLVEELSIKSFEQSQGSPEVREAMARWSTCMKGKGYSVKTIWEAGELIDPTKGESGVDETHLAASEVECKEQTSLIDIWFTSEKAVQEQLIKKHSAELVQASAKNEEIIQQARATVLPSS